MFLLISTHFTATLGIPLSSPTLKGSSKLVVKSLGLTEELQLKLVFLSTGEESGIPSVAVKCVDIRRNTSGEGDFLDDN